MPQKKPFTYVLDDLELLVRIYFLGISRDLADLGGNNG